MNQSFWSGKNVFLTGHTGFKGSWLSIWLTQMGAKVTGFSLAPTSDPNLFSLAGMEDRIQSQIGDIRNFEQLQSALKKSQADVVLHLAAQPLVRPSYRDPIETYGTNVMGTVHLLEAVRQIGRPCAVLIVTTDKCYENREWVWGYRENEAMGGYDPYSSSKGCAELVTSAFRRSFFNPAEFTKHGIAVGSARAGNVIGGGDWSVDRLLPDMVRSFLRGEKVLIRSPLATRPWQHVLEPLAGYLLLAEKLASGDTRYAEGFNFGPADADCVNVGKVVGNFADLWGSGAEWGQDLDPQPHEANFLKLDSSKAKSLLGWEPRWALPQALKATVDWYKSALIDKADAHELCLAQIQAYSKR